jgi:predicted metallo-beta-lactamase superfamily hydrolase
MNAMSLDIIGAESMGVRSLCCLVTLPDRRIVIDPGVALGYWRHGLLPHPLQVAVGVRVRRRIVQVLADATDIVFSHFHGDHVPLVDANPYQLSVHALPDNFHLLRCWSKSDDGHSARMSKRFHDLANILGANMHIADGRAEGPMMFSRAVPHGAADSKAGTVMMTRIEVDQQIFVHASDIQLLDAPTVDRVIDWQPDILLAAGPPLYIDRLGKTGRACAWSNALRLVRNIDVVILDHHLMRSEAGVVWLDRLSAAAGRKVYCAADYMNVPRRLLEAERPQLYQKMVVPHDWHEKYARGQVDADKYFNI